MAEKKLAKGMTAWLFTENLTDGNFEPSLFENKTEEEMEEKMRKDLKADPGMVDDDIYNKIILVKIYKVFNIGRKDIAIEEEKPKSKAKPVKK